MLSDSEMSRSESGVTKVPRRAGLDQPSTASAASAALIGVWETPRARARWSTWRRSPGPVDAAQDALAQEGVDAVGEALGGEWSEVGRGCQHGET